MQIKRHTCKNGYHYTYETSEEVDISICNMCHCLSSCTYIEVITGSPTVTNTVHQYLIGWTQLLVKSVFFVVTASLTNFIVLTLYYVSPFWLACCVNKY